MDTEPVNEEQDLAKILSVYFLIFVIRFNVTESHPFYSTVIFFTSKIFNFFAWPAIVLIILNKLNISTMTYSMEFVFIFWASLVTFLHFLKNDQIL